MLSRPRVESPMGAKEPVSIPDQLTPVNRTSRSAASTSFEPRALNGPLPSGNGVAVGEGVGVGVGSAVGVGSGVGVGVGPATTAQPATAMTNAGSTNPSNCGRLRQKLAFTVGGESPRVFPSRHNWQIHVHAMPPVDGRTTCH